MLLLKVDVQKLEAGEQTSKLEILIVDVQS